MKEGEKEGSQAVEGETERQRWREGRWRGEFCSEKDRTSWPICCRLLNIHEKERTVRRERGDGRERVHLCGWMNLTFDDIICMVLNMLYYYVLCVRGIVSFANVCVPNVRVCLCLVLYFVFMFVVHVFVCLLCLCVSVSLTSGC